ncbi:MAG: class B sortase [Blautia sp.]|nr:class B sortase [Blautia sp.]
MGKQKPKKKKTFVDYLLTIILIAAVAVFCYAAYYLINIYLEYKKGVDEYNTIAEMAVTERAPDEEVPEETPANENGGSRLVPPMIVDFEKLQQVNGDVCGWIYVEALDGVNYPMVRGEDNSYYLHMTYEKNYNFAGTIFLDFENKRDFSDCNTIIYGHNMKNGSMFGQLKRFTTTAETYKKSKYFWIFTPEASYRYEIISAYTTAVDSDTYTLFKGPGSEFEEYLTKIRSYSQIPEQGKPDKEPDIMDKIVTLSTCTGDYSTRYVVQGVRVDTITN